MSKVHFSHVKVCITPVVVDEFIFSYADSHSLLLKRSSDESCPNVNGNCSILAEVMDLDAEYICKSLCSTLCMCAHTAFSAQQYGL